MDVRSPVYRLLAIAFAWMVLASPAAHSADSALIVKATPLRSAPAADAVSRMLLRQGDQVEVTRRQAGWVEVKTNGGLSGWVHITGIKLSTPSVAQRARGFFRWFGDGARPQPETTSMVTIGVRGISEQALAAAEPNMVALAQMEAVPSGPDQGNAFAKSRKLRAESVAYLPAQPGAPS